jgi:hypothetical protein
MRKNHKKHLVYGYIGLLLGLLLGMVLGRFEGIFYAFAPFLALGVFGSAIWTMFGLMVGGVKSG